MTAERSATETTLKVTMHCEGCARAITVALRRTEGVIRVDADHRTDTVRLRFDPERVGVEEIRERIRAAGFDPEETG